MKNQIREVRKAAKITQAELAKVIGITHATLSRYESGAIDPPTSQLQAIAAALGVSVGRLLGQESERVIIPGRLKFVEVNDPESGLMRYDIEATDQEAFDYGLQILENAGVSVQAHTPQALVLAAMDKLNHAGQQKAVERVEELTEIPRYKAGEAPLEAGRDTPEPPEGRDTTPAEKPTEGPPEPQE